ncbi:MAG: GAF domain-containing protein [Acidobacteriota bacterium]
MATQGVLPTGRFERMLERAQGFARKLLAENAQLRRQIALLRASGPSAEPTGPTDRERELETQLVQARQTIQRLEAVQGPLSSPGQTVGAPAAEETERELATLRRRHAELEEQNDNLANLYVASYQLHSTLDFQEVISIVMEIVVNLIGVRSFAVMLIDGKTDDLCVITTEGMDRTPSLRIRVGEGVIGQAATSGQPYFKEDGRSTSFVDPLAVIPLKIKDHVIGAISVYELLPQKEDFAPVDYELFNMLAGHASTAIFSAKLYSDSERKLTTIQSFLDLLTSS